MEPFMELSGPERLDRRVRATLDGVTTSGVVSGFDALPRRVFLDSSTLQALMRYGNFVWENVRPSPGDRAYSIPGFLGDLEALRLIFQVNERAGFDIVVSPNSVSEVDAKGEPGYTSWVLDVLDHWLIRIEEYQGIAFDDTGPPLASKLDDPRFGYLSAKDKLLIQDALALECDAFLTMEKKLAKNAANLRAAVGIEVLRPPDYWALLQQQVRGSQAESGSLRGVR
jgi:hypothetical protein